MFELLEILRCFFAFAGYIGGGAVFPQPLSQQEEAECIRAMAEGDEDAKNRLIECNLRLVAHIVKKYANLDVETDDLISIGTIGLIKGVNTYRPEKSSKLATYISRCVENEILMFVRSMKKQNARVSLCDPIGADKEGNAITLEDILQSEESGVSERVELKLRVEELERAMRKALTKRELTVLSLRYGLNGGDRYTQREIASALGISRSYVSRIEKKALEKLMGELRE